MTAKKFAKTCWDNHWIPISVRYGIGENGMKTQWSRLMQTAGKDELEFIRIIEHHEHCLRSDEVSQLLREMARGANRMLGLNRFFRKRRGEGDFHAKNMAEAFSAQGFFGMNLGFCTNMNCGNYNYYEQM